jgi:hypothetical protein
MAKRKPRPAFAKKPARPPEIRGGAPIEMPAIRPASKRKPPAQRELDLAQAYRLVFGTSEGEKVKADLMLCGNVFHEINGVDLFQLGVAEGMRRVALRVTKMLGLQPEHFPAEAWATADVADSMMAA